MGNDNQWPLASMLSLRRRETIRSFWLNLQSACDLAVAEREKGERISKEVIPAQSAA
ncbi:hypothetical protein ACDY96_25375 [Rhizobium mongolense]|uniref:hypothetical protein n=1 Tax=Rhizobium TaxID=379 RepID=UPI001EF76B83|nr:MULTISPECIES: hypothetical protein [Rhizobium]ULJ73851.1 hypothetical protein L2W42_10030 [Rhizobium gallicum]WFU88517.1 hypothetical protein QA644_05405 [Rhizobium sp. CC1099]